MPPRLNTRGCNTAGGLLYLELVSASALVESLASVVVSAFAAALLELIREPVKWRQRVICKPFLEKKHGSA